MSMESFFLDNCRGYSRIRRNYENFLNLIIKSTKAILWSKVNVLTPMAWSTRRIPETQRVDDKLDCWMVVCGWYTVSYRNSLMQEGAEVKFPQWNCLKLTEVFTSFWINLIYFNKCNVLLIKGWTKLSTPTFIMKKLCIGFELK